MRNFKLTASIFFFLLQQSVYSQDTILKNQFSSQYFESVSKKANHFEQKLNKKSQKVLDRIRKAEDKLKRKFIKRSPTSIARNSPSTWETKFPPAMQPRAAPTATVPKD